MSYGNRYSNMFSRRTTANAAATTKLKNHHGSSIGDKHPLEANYKLYNDMFPAFLNATRASYNALFGETELAQRVRNYFDTNQVVLFVNANGKFHQDFKKSSTSFDIAATIKAEFHLMVDDDKHPMMIYRDHQSAPLFLVVARSIHVVADLVRLFGCPCVLQMDYNIPHEDINGVMAIESLKPVVDENLLSVEDLRASVFLSITNGGPALENALYRAWLDLYKYADDKKEGNESQSIDRAGVPEEINQHPVPSSSL